MKDLPGFQDDDIDRLLSGKAPEGGGFADLAAFVRGVRATYVAPPQRDAALNHIAAAAAAAREVVASGTTVAEPSAMPATAEGLLSRWRRRTVLGMSVATMALSISAAAIAATATGGLAVKGDLPGPVQRVVSQAASGVGITLPAGHVASGPSGPRSASRRGGPSTDFGASDSQESEARANPSVSPTSGRGSREGSFQDGGVRPDFSPTDDHRAGRRRDDAENGFASGTTTSAGHDSCVTYAERISGTLGLADGQLSVFLSLVEHDPSAASNPVAEGGKPDAACQSAINTARASAATSIGAGGDDHSGSGSGRPPSPVPTPTVTPTHDSGSASVSADRGGSTPTPTPSPSDLSGHGGG